MQEQNVERKVQGLDIMEQVQSKPALEERVSGEQVQEKRAMVKVQVPDNDAQTEQEQEEQIRV